MKTHALLSPSGADRWVACPASVWMEKDLPRTSSRAADEGSAAHELADICLTDGKQPSEFIGCQFHDFPDWPVTDEMAEHVATYCDMVRSIGGVLLPEDRVSIAHITGETDAGGTSDAVILIDDEIVIVDLKYGMGVRVDAENNRQMLMYADAVRESLDGLATTAQRVRMVICQPRLNHVSEWVLTLPELADHIVEIAKVAKVALALSKRATLPPISAFSPGEKQCRFCKAQSQCPALTSLVLDAFESGEPDSATPAPDLSVLMDKIDLIEPWCKAVRAEVERRLLAGKDVDGYKLVKGKKGNRQWIDEKSAAGFLLTAGLTSGQLFGESLQSPAKIEKFYNKSLEILITQKEGKPSVARYDDKRPAIDLAAEAINCFE
jgi:hypothetical protein